MFQMHGSFSLLNKSHWLVIFLAYITFQPLTLHAQIGENIYVDSLPKPLYTELQNVFPHAFKLEDVILVDTSELNKRYYLELTADSSKVSVYITESPVRISFSQSMNFSDIPLNILLKFKSLVSISNLQTVEAYYHYYPEISYYSFSISQRIDSSTTVGYSVKIGLNGQVLQDQEIYEMVSNNHNH